jgi:ribonuclease P protein component
MTAPEAKPNRTIGPDGDTPPAPSAFPTLKKRREFLAAARSRKWATASMLVQARQRRPDELTAESPNGLAKETETCFRVGYTCSKKVGGAVVRNRAKRRLRAAAADALPRLGRAGWDYVLIGKSEKTIARPFTALVADLEAALDRLHAPPKPGEGGKPHRKLSSKPRGKPSGKQHHKPADQAPTE